MPAVRVTRGVLSYNYAGTPFSGSGSYDGHAKYDITPIVQNWASGQPNCGVVIDNCRPFTFAEAGGIFQPVLLIKYLAKPLAGDVNGDGRVNVVDVVAAVNAFSTLPGDTQWTGGADFNHNGMIDADDLLTVTDNFGKLALPDIPPVIAVQPANAATIEDQPATFSVTALGTTPLSYQWCRDGVAIAGATASSYTLPAASMADSGARFSVLVGNVAGSATSQEATLTVTSKHVVTIASYDPDTSTTLQAGQPQAFSVVAATPAGDPLQYTWTLDGTTIPQVNTSQHTCSFPDESQHVLAILVTGLNGYSASQTWQITVLAQPGLLAYEGFDYGASTICLHGLGGSEIGFAASQDWIVTQNGVNLAVNYSPFGLTFGTGSCTLYSRGGAVVYTNYLAGSNNVFASRKLAGLPAQSGTLWGSYLFSTSVAVPNSANWTGVGVASTAAPATASTDFVAAYIRGDGSPAQSPYVAIAGNTGTGNGSDSGGLALNTTYLLLFKVTNIAGPGTKTITEWILTPDQFAFWKAASLDSLSETATVGTGAGNVWGLATLTSTNALPIDNNDYIYVKSWMQSVQTLTFDELRLGQTADAVTPISGR